VTTDESGVPPREVAYYYPAPYWGAGESDWAKSLLLFFDEIAILLPGYMYGQHHLADPSLTIPLQEQGLLKVLEPNDWIDAEMADRLTTAIIELLALGAFDDLRTDVHFQELSRSRMGWGVDVSLAEWLVAELSEKGLARPSVDGVSVPLHPVVRSTILVALAQLARAGGDRRGLIVNPVASDGREISRMVETLSLDPLPSAGHVVELDLAPIGLDLSQVPLDEVISFRADHGAEYRQYMQNLRGFMAELARLPVEERQTLLDERGEEFADACRSLQRRGVKELGVPIIAWTLVIAGAAWGVATGDVVGLIIDALGLAVGQIPASTSEVTAYSYLLSAGREFGNT